MTLNKITWFGIFIASIVITIVLGILFQYSFPEKQTENIARQFILDVFTLGDINYVTQDNYDNRLEYHKQIYIDYCNKKKDYLKDNFECTYQLSNNSFYMSHLVATKVAIKEFDISPQKDTHRISALITIKIVYGIDDKIFSGNGNFIKNTSEYTVAIGFTIQNGKIIDDSDLQKQDQLYLFWNGGSEPYIPTK